MWYLSAAQLNPMSGRQVLLQMRPPRLQPHRVGLQGARVPTHGGHQCPRHQLGVPRPHLVSSETNPCRMQLHRPKDLRLVLCVREQLELTLPCSKPQLSWAWINFAV
ncbi:unnamed protein product, partial [Symbiodinium sp. KB8]